jgi:hydrogenase maturation protease
MTDLLVIGYGNELRRDDGAGPRVAASVAALGLPGVRAVSSHQLTPEMADLLRDAEAVMFVDARADAPAVGVERLAPSPAGAGWGHTSDPRWLLGLTAALYDHAPAAWLVTIPAVDLGMGEGLSDQAARGVAVVIRRIEAMAALGERGAPCTKSA